MRAINAFRALAMGFLFGFCLLIFEIYQILSDFGSRVFCGLEYPKISEL